MSEKEKYQIFIQRLTDDYFIKVYYEEDKKSFDWILRPDYTPEDLRIAILGLKYYEEKTVSPTKQDLIDAYRKGQESVRAIRNIDTYKEDSAIKDILTKINSRKEKTRV